jgi:TM2 domain-containing membrane protein YozV
MSEERKAGLDEKYCTSCGAIIKKAAELCPGCGVRQKAAPLLTDSSKSRVTAGLLAILLGDLGVHKFYMGKAGLGCLYILFCWTFIPAIIALIEGIIYLTMDDESFSSKYNV